MSDAIGMYDCLPNADLLEKVLRDPIVRALRPRTRLFYLVCVMLAWEPLGDDDERCGCLRRLGVGPYDPEDVAEVTGLSTKRVRKEARRLRSVGLADLTQIDGQWYLRIVGCRPSVRAQHPCNVGDPTTPPVVPPDLPACLPADRTDASDAEDQGLAVDDLRVEMLTQQGVSAGIARKYGGQYTFEDLFIEIIRLMATPGVRCLPAVLTANLKEGRITPAWMIPLDSPGSVDGFSDDEDESGYGRRTPYADPEELEWPEDGW